MDYLKESFVILLDFPALHVHINLRLRGILVDLLLILIIIVLLRVGRQIHLKSIIFIVGDVTL